MPKKGIVTGQRVSPELYARAKELRQNMTPAELLLWQHLRAGRLQGVSWEKARKPHSLLWGGMASWD
jgi:very-short-patch-repair endonuclease